MWQAFIHKFRCSRRRRRRSGYFGPQKLKVLFQGVSCTLGILNQKNLQPAEIIV